ncbi:Glycoside hydrolase family 17 [Dillenia turbinata]|uniref:Glycoside hydrolase family 17 n=1 Tax=Dillenia turbinata TaxID=194707 RepID=A0AAN8W4A8_9MAGN
MMLSSSSGLWIGLLVLAATALYTAEAVNNVGVCYGMQGDDLPSPQDVINLYQKYNIAKIRLFDPVPEALEALSGSGLEINIGVTNQDIPTIAQSQEDARAWFADHISNYLSDMSTLKYIAVGNEVIPDEFSESVLPAMQFLNGVVSELGLSTKITTVVGGKVLGESFPPSASEFSDASVGYMRDILSFLSSTSAPLMVNVYPYFAYSSDPSHISLAYAQFTSEEVVVRDGDLGYKNIFDAMVDSFVWSMEKANGGDVSIVVSESGWPSAGNGNFTSTELASSYNTNFFQHVRDPNGTPKRPGANIEGFIFAMFNEDQKPAGVEQNWGLFYPNMEPVYKVF